MLMNEIILASDFAVLLLLFSLNTVLQECDCIVADRKKFRSKFCYGRYLLEYAVSYYRAYLMLSKPPDENIKNNKL